MPGGDAGRAGNGAGRGALSQPQPRADGVCAVYDTSFASWVCGPLPFSAAVEGVWYILAVVEPLCLY